MSVTPSPATVAEHLYRSPSCWVSIKSGVVTAVFTNWRGLRHSAVAPLTDYAGLGRRIVMRRDSWLSRHPTQYAQILLLHRNDRDRDIVLWDELVQSPPLQPHALVVREMLERISGELGLPIFDGARPPKRLRESLQADMPEAVFGMRMPDEVEMCIRDLVMKGRMIVARDIAPLPRGILMRADGDRLVMNFRISAWWETTQILMALGGILLAGFAKGGARYRGLLIKTLPWLLGIAVVVLGFATLVVFPIKYFMGGNELVLSQDKWVYRPAPASGFSPDVRIESFIPIKDIEDLRREGPHVIVTMDNEILRIRCASRAIAEWMRQALLAVSAYGLEPLQAVLPPTANAAMTGKGPEIGETSS